MTDFDLTMLYRIVQSRKDADPDKSYVAKLFSKGRHKMCQKVGEEAAEVIIDAVADKRSGTISESADLLFHLTVLWSEMGIRPEEVFEKLSKRQGVSGIDEKKKRKK